MIIICFFFQHELPYNYPLILINYFFASQEIFVEIFMKKSFQDF